MPDKIDLTDSDGDQTPNGLDKDKFKADVVVLEKIDASMEFELGQSHLVKHKFNLSNNIDLQNYSKDLMVKNIVSIPKNHFFSEFSFLKIKPDKALPLVLDGSTRIRLNFSKVKTAPKSLFLVTENKQIRIGNWSELMDFSLTQDELESILSGKFFFSLSHMDKKSDFNQQSLEENIKSKTYRVFYNDGQGTEVHYLSRNLSLNEILKKFHITKYRLIDEQNLLRTIIKPLTPEWWVRFINQSDIIIINENLRGLSNHYFKGLSKIKNVVSRINGFNVNKFIIKKNIDSRVLLKIRAEQRMISFSESSKDHRVRVGGQDHDKYGCVDHTRFTSKDFVTEFIHSVFLQTFLVNGKAFQVNKNIIALRNLSDETGLFWEIELAGAENFEIGLINLPASNYKQVGVFKSVDCIGDDRDAKYRNNLQVPEKSLNVQIEAFVENI